MYILHTLEEDTRRDIHMRIVFLSTRDPRRVRRHYNDPCITIVPLHCLLVLTCDYIFFSSQANVKFTLAVCGW